MTGLYIVTKPTKCCGSTNKIGFVVNIVEIHPVGGRNIGCAACKTPADPNELMAIAENRTFGTLYRLTKIGDESNIIAENTDDVLTKEECKV